MSSLRGTVKGVTASVGGGFEFKDMDSVWVNVMGRFGILGFLFRIRFKIEDCAVSIGYQNMCAVRG